MPTTLGFSVLLYLTDPAFSIVPSLFRVHAKFKPMALGSEGPDNHCKTRTEVLIANKELRTITSYSDVCVIQQLLPHHAGWKRSPPSLQTKVNLVLHTL